MNNISLCKFGLGEENRGMACGHIEFGVQRSCPNASKTNQKSLLGNLCNGEESLIICAVKVQHI